MKTKPTWCKHFRSAFHNETCRVGVNYDTQFPEGLVNAPCFYRNKDKMSLCPKCEYPTQEEVEKHEKELADHIQKTLGVVGMIDQERKSKKITHGAFSCPACKTGVVSWSVATCNGHRRGRCSTENCVNFIE